MPHFNLRYFMETLGEQRGKDVFLLQIGAMDGKTFDPIHEYVERFHWMGLMVEPIKEYFLQLQDTYRHNPRIAYANVAIAEQSGTAIMHRIPTDNIVNKDVPKWGLGAASLYADRNALGFDAVRPFVVQEEVICVTLPQLLQSYDIGRVDILQIDAEGHDYHILKQMDFERYHPRVIHLEIVNMPKGEQTACKKWLDRFGYIHIKAGYDLLAVAPDFFGLVLD